jgi:hypothetical protein
MDNFGDSGRFFFQRKSGQKDVLPFAALRCAGHFQVPPKSLKIPGSSFFLQDKKNQKRRFSGFVG